MVIPSVNMCMGRTFIDLTRKQGVFYERESGSRGLECKADTLKHGRTKTLPLKTIPRKGKL